MAPAALPADAQVRDSLARLCLEALAAGRPELRELLREQADGQALDQLERALP